MPSPRKADWPIVAALVIVVALAGLPALYVGGYFARSKAYQIRPGEPYIIRRFQSRRELEFFHPMIKVERMATGRRINPGVRTDDLFSTETP
jgi:hypothetical protein